MKVAILGGTGSFGRALATRLGHAGVETLIGSREAARGAEIAAEVGVSGGSNEEVIRAAELIVLAVNADAALDTARELSGPIGSTPLLSVASRLRFTKSGVLPGSGEQSIAEQVAEIVDAPVAAGLHSLAASNLGQADPPDEDTLVCGDDPAAKEASLALAAKLVTGRAIDAGPLQSARALEGLTAVIVNMNRRYKGHAGFRVTGLP
jgi:8-hydroxy-5-deazaflavin:NADPH oxidoreductase